MTDPAQTTFEHIAALPGLLLLEFGAFWCGFCTLARPHVESVLLEHPEIRHFRVEDGRGQPLGRSFGVKLWPTLVLLQDAKEIARMVRPRSRLEVARLMERCPSVPPER